MPTPTLPRPPFPASDEALLNFRAWNSPQAEGEDMSGLLNQADLALMQLKTIASAFSGQGRLTRPFQFWEAVASSRLAGARATLLDLLFFEGEPSLFIPNFDVRALSSHLAVLELGQSLSSYEGLDPSLIPGLHHFLLTGKLATEAHPGPEIPGGSAPAGDLWERSRRATGVPALLQAAFLHRQIAAARPFADGNGRLARMLCALLLAEQKAAPQPFLCLSPYFERHAEEYQERLRGGSGESGWDAWSAFFLRAVRHQAMEGVHRAQALLRLQGRYRELVMGQGKGAKTALKILGYLLEIPLLTAQTLEKKGGMSAPTAQKTIAFWAEAGVLREITGYRRGRVYLAQDLFDLATEDWTDPFAKADAS